MCTLVADLSENSQCPVTTVYFHNLLAFQIETVLPSKQCYFLPDASNFHPWLYLFEIRRVSGPLHIYFRPRNVFKIFPMLVSSEFHFVAKYDFIHPLYHVLSAHFSADRSGSFLSYCETGRHGYWHFHIGSLHLSSVPLAVY